MPPGTSVDPLSKGTAISSHTMKFLVCTVLLALAAVSMAEENIEKNVEKRGVLLASPLAYTSSGLAYTQPGLASGIAYSSPSLASGLAYNTYTAPKVYSAYSSVPYAYGSYGAYGAYGAYPYASAYNGYTPYLYY